MKNKLKKAVCLLAACMVMGSASYAVDVEDSVSVNDSIIEFAEKNGYRLNTAYKTVLVKEAYSTGELFNTLAIKQAPEGSKLYWYLPYSPAGNILEIKDSNGKEYPISFPVEIPVVEDVVIYIVYDTEPGQELVAEQRSALEYMKDISKTPNFSATYAVDGKGNLVSGFSFASISDLIDAYGASTVSSVLGSEVFMRASKEYTPKEVTKSARIPVGSIALSNKKEGYFRGSDGKALPNEKLTVAQAVAMVVRMSDEFQTYSVDTKGKPWHFKEMSFAKAKGMLGSISISKPGRVITRGEFAELLASIKSDSDGKETALTEKQTPAIAKALENKWVQGYPDGGFGENRGLTRAEAVVVINRIIGVSNKFLDGRVDTDRLFKDISQGDWFYAAIVNAAKLFKYGV